MPAAVHALSELGVKVDGRPFRGIRYLAGGQRAQALFKDGPGLGVRRTALHAALAGSGRGAGHRDRRAAGDPGRAGRRTRVYAAGVEARYLAVADGLHSPVRRLLGLDRTSPGRARYGIRRHYHVRPWTDLVEVHWSRHSEAYVTPVSEALVGVAILTSRRAPFEEQLRGFPALPSTCPRAGSPRREARARCGRAPRARVHGRALLVGDAAGYVDALTGEGVSDRAGERSGAGGLGTGRRSGVVRAALAAGHPAVPAADPLVALGHETALLRPRDRSGRKRRSRGSSGRPSTCSPGDPHPLACIARISSLILNQWFKHSTTAPASPSSVLKGTAS